MKVILNAQQIDTALRELADNIIKQTPSDAQLAVIGIRSRGEIIAGRLCSLLSQKLK